MNCFLLFPVRMKIICRNQYSTRERNGAQELDGVTALYSRYEQVTTQIQHTCVVLHKINSPYAYLQGDGRTDGRTHGRTEIFTQYSGISSCSQRSTDRSGATILCLQPVQHPLKVSGTTSTIHYKVTTNWQFYPTKNPNLTMTEVSHLPEGNFNLFSTTRLQKNGW